jgi:hypothetical protein
MSNEKGKHVELRTKGMASFDKHGLFLVDLYGSILFICDGTAAMSHSCSKPLIRELDRAEILEAFSYLEAILTWLICITISQDLKKILLIKDLLLSISLSSKIAILDDWSIINAPMKRRLDSIKTIRNQLAHSWNDGVFKYKGEIFSRDKHNGFKKFCDDFNHAWKDLEAIFLAKQISVDILLTEMR